MVVVQNFLKSILLLMLFSALHAEETVSPKQSNKQSEQVTKSDKENNIVTLEYELDPYYSNVGLYVSLTEEPIKNLEQEGEWALYRDLALSSFSPRFFVIEASINPLPIVGAAIKSNARGFYDSMELTQGVNLVQAVTEGFEEPYALSAFLGNVVSFTEEGEDRKVSNKGYTGLLLSVGNKHIKDNVIIDDKWVEFEWKVKGDRRFNNRDLSWSFRIGSKIHQHSDITDIYYVAIRRSHFSKFMRDISSTFRNMGFEYKLEFDQSGGRLVQQQLFMDKKWPFAEGDGAFSLGFGVVQDRGKYRGGLNVGADNEEFRLMLRPSLNY